jgi:inhibitor of KinA sporulation pathway (predicted exonuclease)
LEAEVRYVIVDLEATCWETGQTPDRMEIIEIGAVLLEASTGPASGEFAAFVKPVASPRLSEFCKQLTSIRQEDIDRAGYFWEVFPQFLEWIGSEPYTLCSWGAYDLNQLRRDCERHQIPFPQAFERHVNLKRAYSELRRVRPMGMRGALMREGLELEGTHHRGIDDARNIARLAQIILPPLENAGRPGQDGPGKAHGQ